jgi:MSHA biogenesis protein MshM
VLLVALRSGEGFVKVTGEVGTGKTLLCRMLLNALEGELTSPPTCPIPASGATACAPHWPRNWAWTARAISASTICSSASGRLLVWPPAGTRRWCASTRPRPCSDEALEAIRLLTNLETEHNKLLQVVLFGQPELDARLAMPGLRQLRQRITFSHRLEPLDAPGVARYVQHRLRVAGAPRPDLFAPRALRALHRASGGIPRLVNILAHKSLLAAYGEGAARVTSGHVRRATRDTEGARVPPWISPWAYGAVGTLGLGAGALIAMGSLLP